MKPLEDDLGNVRLHLERLRRSYDRAVKEYDKVSLWELSHALRIWTDYKKPLKTISPEFSSSKSFTIQRPTNNMKVYQREYATVFALFPGGVTSCAHNGKIAGQPELDLHGGLHLNFNAMIDDKNRLHMDWYFAVFAGEETKISYENIESENVPYSDWLEREAVRVTVFEKPSDKILLFQISRELFASRAANVLDGSHPSAASDPKKANQCDPIIKYLLRFPVAGLPLTYLILLKMAQDILAVASPAFKLDGVK